MGAGRPRRAEREGPDDSELSRSDDDDGVGRDWSEPKANGTPRMAFFHAHRRRNKFLEKTVERLVR